jgi:hypothetical protein
MLKIDSKVFTEDFVKSVTEEVKRQIDSRTSETQTVTRKDIVKAFGFTDGKQQLAAENVISLLFSMGLIEGYKTSRKAGIKPADWVASNKVKAKKEKA